MTNANILRIIFNNTENITKIYKITSRDRSFSSKSACLPCDTTCFDRKLWKKQKYGFEKGLKSLESYLKLKHKEIQVKTKRQNLKQFWVVFISKFKEL